MLRANIYGINIVLETDQKLLLKNMLEFEVQERGFDFRKGRVDFKTVRKKIYNRTLKNQKTGTQYFEVGIGWAAYILGILGAYLPMEDVEGIKREIYSPTHRVLPFPNLRDHQNSDMLHLLKYRYGLCTVTTGYGKSECIATLAKEFADLGLKVLLVTPGSKARDELLKRIRVRFGIEVPDCLVTTATTKKARKLAESSKILSVITSGFLNQKAIKDKTLEPGVLSELGSFDVVLSDEVEYCINPAGEYIFQAAENAQLRYAFSGTADKGNGSMISFRNGLTDPAVSGNLGLIRFFGPSLIYRKPLDRNLELIDIKTDAFKDINLEFLGDDQYQGNKYLDVMTEIFTNPEICGVITNVIGHYRNLFIPVNNLTSLIEPWIENYWKGKYRVLLVCGEGYIYYDLAGNRKSITLQEACDKIAAGDVDVIPSTAAGFRALDFPNLSNILLFAGKIAGAVLQAVGRVARQTNMRIITLSPSKSSWIPMYSKGCIERRNMIKEYYKYCKITETSITDMELSMLGIYG